MGQIWVVTIAVILLFSIIMFSSSNEAFAEKYYYEKYQFSIDYPPNWSKHIGVFVESESNERILVLKPPSVPGILIVDLEHHTEMVPVKDMAENTIASLRLHYFNNFNLEQSESTILSGQPAWKFVYTITESGTTLKILEIASNNDDGTSNHIMFSHTVDSFDSLLPTVQKIIDSIQIEGMPSQIPDRIRNIAKWWSDGITGDSDFASGIQFMIKENIISIPDLPEQASETTYAIPNWVRNNAGWWADGLISEDDFVSGIKYLVEQGIIKV